MLADGCSVGARARITGPAAMGRGCRIAEGAVRQDQGDFVVIGVVSEPPDVTTLDRWEAAPDRDRGVPVAAREVELLEPRERAHDR